jgi:hypothetical protein
MSVAKIDALARLIADDLFVNGSGDQADRLVLWVDADERNLGGWAKRAVVDRVRTHLRRAVGATP